MADSGWRMADVEDMRYPQLVIRFFVFRQRFLCSLERFSQGVFIVFAEGRRGFIRITPQAGEFFFLPRRRSLNVNPLRMTEARRGISFAQSACWELKE